MATAVALQTKGRELAETLSGIINDDKMTAAEKSAALDKIQPEFEAHEAEVKNSERAAALRGSLGEMTNENRETEFDGSRMKSLEQEMLEHPGYAEAVKASGGLKGLDPKGQFRQQFELGRSAVVKDATAAANQMGDSLYGATGPAALGQNPFFANGPAAQSVMPHWVPGIVDLRFADIDVASIFPSSPTESPAISYLVEATYVNNADVVNEAGQYPYSSDTWTRQYEQVGKIANAIKITDEMLADADQFVSFMRGRLVSGIQRKESVALLAGPGGQSVNGLLNRSTGFTLSTGGGTATVTNVVFPPSGQAGTAVVPTTVASMKYGRVIAGASTGVYPVAGVIAEGIFAALVDIQNTAFCSPNAIVMNPSDWSVIRMAKDSAGQYLGGSFFGTAYGQSGLAVPETLWNKRVIVSAAIPAGTVLVGEFSTETLNVFRRAGISVEMSNSNGNDFDHGLVTVRAEERLGLAVFRPAAFELIQLKNG